MCACHNVIPIESPGTCKHNIGLDTVSCKQSTESFNWDYFNRNAKKCVNVNVPRLMLQKETRFIKSWA